ncbi:L,D-transpeptidase family protein [Aliiroseovarius sp.]|uniref:L,D-transpeptidase family protein n=1 Tax=Aliiroseovarius sp. TaxID=1872442 RepID=UPI003BACB058
MLRLARLFSALTFLLILTGAAVVLYDRYSPVAPPVTVALPDRIDRILIEKSARRMTLWKDGEVVRTYDIALGFDPEGDKDREGDGRTPEGTFTIDRRNPNSAYHLSLGIDYPQPEDVARGRAGGYSPGGDIMIHGQPNGLGRIGAIPYDWTAGCIAVSDAEMREIWAVAGIGTEVEIRP